MRPRIGVTCGAEGVRASYSAAVEAAGGEVVELRPDTIAEVDGVLLTGGPDIEPGLYNQQRVDETGKPDLDRDRFELELARRAQSEGWPVLAVCRGLQVAAVAFGGSLTQHVAGHKDPTMRHLARIVDGSRLNELVGAHELSVNSRHHQVVNVLPEDFRINAVSAEGYVEGMESGDGQVLGVQCHPEDLQDEQWAKTLFADLIARASKSAEQRTKQADRPPAVGKETTARGIQS